MKDPILLLTSFSFIVPVTYAAYNDMWDIYSSLLCVLLTSVAYHSSKEPILKYIDQAAIVQLIIMSCKTGYELELLYIGILNLSWMYYVYIHGYKTNSLAFHPNYIVASLFHGSFHVSTSVSWMYGIYVKQLQNESK
uniref:Uncharacterized protein n=1 Tax=viral metagenome TaxID=1070528 RepID=A0A6C0DGJ9_9ZZZZ